MKRRACVLFPLVAVLLAAPTAAGNLSDVFKRVNLSVVVVETAQRELPASGPAVPVTVGGLGSGVLISNDGKVMTAAHVVQTAEAIQVVFQSGERIPARVLASEPPADVALLQLERMPQVARIARLGDSDTVEVGEEIFVVGAPFGISHTLTVGHISARRMPDRMLGPLGLAEFFQTDAAINTGNSGGPMFNMDGEVIGIVSHIVTMTGGSEGLGFAVTSNMAREILLERKSMWSGMDAFLLRGELARIFNVPQPTGVLVQKVASGSLAAHLGLKPGYTRASIGGEEMIVGGDIILEVLAIPMDGTVEGYDRLRAAFEQLEENDKIEVKVLRGGEVVEVSNFFFPDLLIPQPLDPAAGHGGAPRERATLLKVLDRAYVDPGVRVLESYPPQFELVLQRDMPTPGYTFRVDAVQVDEDEGRIVARITEQRPGGMVSQVITRTEMRIPLGSLATGRYALEIHTRRKADGPYYLTDALALQAAIKR